MKNLNAVIEDNENKFAHLRVQLRNMGYHSTQKVSEGMVDFGCKVSFPMTIICSGVYWSVVPVKFIYIHYEKSGNKYVGRSITDLSVLIAHFVFFLTYFATEGRENVTTKEESIDRFTKENLSGYDRL